MHRMTFDSIYPILGDLTVFEQNEAFVKVYLSTVEGPNRKGGPLGRWEDRVKEYLSERGVRGNSLEQERVEFTPPTQWLRLF